MGIFSGKKRKASSFFVATESRANDIMLRFHDCCQNYREITKNQEFVVQKLKEPVLDEIKGLVKGLHLFPVPKPDSKHIITFANQSDYISFRHHVYRQSGGPKSIDLKEVGPRFELKLYQLGRNFMQHTPKTRSTFVFVRMRT
ncbi:U3 small nucleolar ribonucleoprotein protein IMP4 [Lactuca sativa]|uniref:Brix domain-containing protein n=1 Tax=Lactuca sativa TaxID=4236 RepID=A0A9R1WP52_LACSA|nr:U3 small nucleolar ribonucleoprotein protein IMP4 [Lactuca sativa]KAJ0226212.1 hypothetical protein LSAT_V11C100003490 [Lactuca sativa]